MVTMWLVVEPGFNSVWFPILLLTSRTDSSLFAEKYCIFACIRKDLETFRNIPAGLQFFSQDYFYYFTKEGDAWEMKQLVVGTQLVPWVVIVHSLSCIQLFVTPWTEARQASLVQRVIILKLNSVFPPKGKYFHCICELDPKRLG